jgi:hypothetical protein
MSSMAKRTPSRPRPLSLTPPYGMWSTRHDGTSLINTPPTSRRSHARCAFWMSRVNRPACKPVAAGVDAPQGFVEIGKRRQHRDRPEYLLAAHLIIVRHLLQQRRLDHVAPAPPSAQEPCPARLRGRHPGLDAIRFLRRDDGADERILLLRIARLQLAGGRHQKVAERRIHAFVDQDTLHADAALAGLVERAHQDAGHRVLQVRIFVHQTRRVAAQFQHHLLLAGPRLQGPPHLGRTGETQKLDALVGDEPVRALPVTGQDRKRAPGQVGLRQDLAQHQRTDRRQAGRLQHKGTPHRQRGGNLVRHEVEREVEG